MVSPYFLSRLRAKPSGQSGSAAREPRWPDGIRGDREKRYGETVLWYGHAAPESPDETQE